MKSLPACLPAEEPPWSEDGIVSWGRYLDQRPTAFLSPCKTRIGAHAPPCHVLGLTAAVLFSMGKCYISVPVRGWRGSEHSLKNWERRAHEAAHVSVSAGICWHLLAQRPWWKSNVHQEKSKELVGPQESWTETPLSPGSSELHLNGFLASVFECLQSSLIIWKV